MRSEMEKKCIQKKCEKKRNECEGKHSTPNKDGIQDSTIDIPKQMYAMSPKASTKVEKRWRRRKKKTRRITRRIFNLAFVLFIRSKYFSLYSWAKMAATLASHSCCFPIAIVCILLHQNNNNKWNVYKLSYRLTPSYVSHVIRNGWMNDGCRLLVWVWAATTSQIHKQVGFFRYSSTHSIYVCMGMVFFWPMPPSSSLPMPLMLLCESLAHFFLSPGARCTTRNQRMK